MQIANFQCVYGITGRIRTLRTWQSDSIQFNHSLLKFKLKHIKLLLHYHIYTPRWYYTQRFKEHQYSDVDALKISEIGFTTTKRVPPPKNLHSVCPCLCIQVQGLVGRRILLDNDFI